MARTRISHFTRRDHKRLLSNRWNVRRDGLSISKQIDLTLGRTSSFLARETPAKTLWGTRRDF